MLISTQRLGLVVDASTTIRFSVLPEALVTPRVMATDS
jgi:hypothetical protein